MNAVRIVASSVTSIRKIIPITLLALAACDADPQTPASLTENQVKYSGYCNISVPKKAALAFRLRANGVSVSDARRQLGSVEPGTVGYLEHEAVLEGAYASHTSTSNEAVLFALANCVERYTEALGS